jgi:hypothetical protein
MPAPSTLLSSLQSRLSDDSLQLLQGNASSNPPPQPDTISDDEKVALFDNVLDEVEGTDQSVLFASVTPQALPQATEELWQEAQRDQAMAQPSQIGKERSTGAWSLDSAVQESGGMLAAVETEKQPEISPEVERFLQKVDDNQESPAEELAKLIPKVVTSAQPDQTEVVRVLPVTKQMAEEGHKKSPTFSIRWLVEWSEKVIKMFKGKAVYRTPDTPSA